MHGHVTSRNQGTFFEVERGPWERGCIMPAKNITSYIARTELQQSLSDLHLFRTSLLCDPFRLISAAQSILGYEVPSWTPLLKRG